ncbi:hypothetical protein EDL98_02860 [Ornithobacterium rhinotracheale]|uniref:hypothetical protein n=1 Tax=Ornithobacterium rhinotracheale TaxID=28251 RepID=UPI00129C2B37|nr:hypothetical protein [Ornithobacterium rhinotracheale]MRJ08843.1 hypothetical protein [Ornithobacterium rhinotracheale]MRJ10024.1 hypothetical protein [Ornithobacterium rhinotracheale]UOH77724.1 hypothetical protein MT996_11030 [Ornithobacterium rhinotracheale]
MKRIALLFISFFVLASCLDSDRKDEELSLQRKEYTGNNLRLDGFYYLTWINDGVEEFYATTFLFKNGIQFGLGGGGPVREMDSTMKKYLGINYKTRKSGWGVFAIKNEEIVMESYGATQLGYKVIRQEGKILNDTTFVVKESSKIVDGQKTDVKKVNDVYHFKEFSPKPSSENDFIK